MKMFSSHLLPKESAVHVLLILLVSFSAYLLLIANPGYFSHDELQRFDFFTQYGSTTYFQQMLNLNPGENFGSPMRPFAFLIQGLQNPYIRDFPVLVHLSAVLVSATVACLQYLLSSLLGLSRKTALVAALVFLFNPMTVHASGWVAALMDQWFILWGLLGMLAAVTYVQQRQYSTLNPVLIFICAALALLTKETAIVLPAAPIALVFLDKSLLKQRRYLIAVAAWVLPVLIYLGFRLVAIKSSFSGNTADPYAASIHNIIPNLYAYFLFPFMTNLGELQSWTAYPQNQPLLSVLIHLVLLAALISKAGFKSLLFYLGGYFLFLFPVLFIPGQSSHYLFGSALITSVALAYLLTLPGQRLIKGLTSLCLLVLIIHSLKFQTTLYQDGACMARLSDSTESLYLSNGKPTLIQFQFDPATRAHVLLRFTHARNQIGTYYPLEMRVLEEGTTPQAEGVLAYLNKDCIAYQVSTPAQY